MESPNPCLMRLCLMQPPAYSDNRKKKGALITHSNKITTLNKRNQMSNKLLLLQWLSIFKQMYESIRGSQRLFLRFSRI